MKFARLFDFKTNQLLLNITINDQRNGYLLNIETYHQGVLIKTGLAFAELEEAQQALDGFTEPKAQELYYSLIKAVSEPPATISHIIEGLETWLKNSKN